MTKSSGAGTTAKTKTAIRQQTTRVNGSRVKITTRDGKVTISDAPVEEWVLQAAAVRALKAMPEYAATAERVAANDNAGRPSFTIAADMNGDYRSGQAAVKAKATGIAAGDPDLRVYIEGGSLRLIEYKNALGRLTDSQKVRHPLMEALGHPVTTLKVATEDEAARRTVELVMGWLSAQALRLH